ncbi:MAG: MFS transporter [Acidobacteriaceae bacterium]|nr:MFS transporter [Acidobacteriaceae bacterium]
MTEARIWYSRDPDQQLLPGDCQNMVVLSDEFYREVQNHPIPTDLEAAKALSASPAVLDLFTWLSYRCFTAKGRERVPLFGEFGTPALYSEHFIVESWEEHLRQHERLTVTDLHSGSRASPPQCRNKPSCSPLHCGPVDTPRRSDAEGA